MTDEHGRRLHVPGIDLARTYDRTWLTPDLLAGVTVWALLVPQALAYAQVAGVDPVVGLYAVIGATIGYLLLGSVRTMSTGPEGTIALVAASIVAPLAAGDPSTYLALMGGLALVVGAALMLAGVLGLGFITRFLSRPLLTGYVAGAAIVMVVGQLDDLLGVTLTTDGGTLAQLAEIIRDIPEANPVDILVGAIVIGVTLGVRRIDARLPNYLIAIFVSIVLSVVFDLGDRIAVVGTIQPGLPPIGLPAVNLDQIVSMLGPALGVALLIFADSGVTGQILGRRSGEQVNGDQEFLGLGAANVGAALTGGFPVNGSQSRSFTGANVGGRSQALNVVALALVVVTLLFLTPLFAPLPKAALAAVILVVAVGLLDPAGFSSLARVDRRDLGLALTAVAIVVVVGLLAGVVVTVVVSLFLVAMRAALPRRTFLVRVPGTDTFRSEDSVESGIPEDGILVYRFDGPLFFANAQLLSDDIDEALSVERAGRPIRRIVLDAEGITDLDTTGAGVLDDERIALESRGIGLHLARVKAPVRAYLERSGFIDRLGRDRIHLEVDDAVDAARTVLADQPVTSPVET